MPDTNVTCQHCQSKFFSEDTKRARCPDCGRSLILFPAPQPRDPINSKEWQEAVDMAEFLLLMESAKMYGLITFDTIIHPKRCCKILELGAKHGYKPQSEDALIKQFLVPA